MNWVPYEVSGLGTAVPEQYNQSYTDMTVYTSVAIETPNYHVIWHSSVTLSSQTKVLSYLPFDKPFASQPSKSIISAG